MELEIRNSVAISFERERDTKKKKERIRRKATRIGQGSPLTATHLLVVECFKRGSKLKIPIENCSITFHWFRCENEFQCNSIDNC